MTWEAVADVGQLEEGEPTLVELGRPVCMVLLSPEEAVAVDDVCPHQRQALHEGYVQDDDTIVCAAHAATFDLRSGEAVGALAVGPLPTYACRIADGVVWIDVERPADAD